MDRRFNFQDVEKIAKREESNPHNLLGLHREGRVVRLWRPQASEIFLEVKGEIVQAELADRRGLFIYQCPAAIDAADYRVFHTNSLLAHDPYSFPSTFGEIDQYLLNSGTHYELYHALGARLTSHCKVLGVKFSVWAPNAKTVSLVADFNHWNELANPMRSLGACGVWELFVPGLKAGERYKFAIKSREGVSFLKADPMALHSELRPATASIVADIDQFCWTDDSWREKKKSQVMNSYEVHLGSWKQREGQFLNYRELAHELASYVSKMGYTHVELLPITEHPLDESWGYQVTGFYAATSRYGTPTDFQYFVNHLHQQGIGVILDWVPAHFPRDHFSLSRFDGTSLYEHADPKQGLHPHWETHIFNFGRKEVSNFLLASALFWVDVMHIDALRVDAVASMLYLDYGREEGEWIANRYGGKENLEAIEFLKHTNSILHRRFPHAMTIAEESTAFPGVTKSVEEGGLGFDLKWNMGWMNDTLRYFQKDPIYRRYHHTDITFGLLYAFTEKFVLALSHDEVVHGKGSLLSKMPGDRWQKFANLRLLLSYMICQPGKKTLFMGGEIAQSREWSCKAELEWSLLDSPLHAQLQTMTKELNQLYRDYSAFWEDDFTPSGFEWVGEQDVQNSIVVYLRKSESHSLLCIHNFTPQYFSEYILYLAVKEAVEIFSTDAKRYGGSGKENSSVEIIEREKRGMKLQIAPLATMIFKVLL